MDYSKPFRVHSGHKFNLQDIPPDEICACRDKEKIKERLAENRKKLLELQYRLYAENKQSLLIVLQAMDAGGKDGVINHVLYAMNPQGCRSQSFKVPTVLEASHDFLWREHNVVPHNGEVVIFNRSHYECVLVERVHGGVTGKKLQQRFEFINDFEKILRSNNTSIIKFYLHISKEEQLKRFGERLNDPAKHWKISENDYQEREFWDAYMEAFSDAIEHCSTDYAPWYVIPSNDKEFRNLAVSDIIVETLEKMNPVIPPATVDIAQIRRLYHQDEVAEGAAPNRLPASGDDSEREKMPRKKADKSAKKQKKQKKRKK